MSDRSNAELTHSTLIFTAVPWCNISATAENYGTRPKSRQKPRWSWIYMIILQR